MTPPPSDLAELCLNDAKRVFCDDPQQVLALLVEVLKVSAAAENQEVKTWA